MFKRVKQEGMRMGMREGYASRTFRPCRPFHPCLRPSALRAPCLPWVSPRRQPRQSGSRWWHQGGLCGRPLWGRCRPTCRRTPR
eukprot:34495_5